MEAMYPLTQPLTQQSIRCCCRVVHFTKTKSKLPRTRTDAPLTANNSSEPPITNTRKPRIINIPRAGSDANAWTDILRCPNELGTYPVSLGENAEIASNTVQALNVHAFRLPLVSASSAVPANQGMNEAFSTGSQNHQPPSQVRSKPTMNLVRYLLLGITKQRLSKDETNEPMPYLNGHSLRGNSSKENATEKLHVTHVP